MKTSLQWLREFVELPSTVSELSDLLTLAGVEVEAIHQRGADFPLVVVAQILESVQHPNADRLSVCKVTTGGDQPHQIVCGAKNYKVSDKVPLALPGAVLPGDFKIKVGKLRGVESQGMLCSAKELGLGEGHEGLLILPPDAPLGQPLSKLYPPDTVLEIEVTPNRPDLLSHYGIAREVAALRSVKLSPLADSQPGVAAPGRVSIEAPSLCPFYSARRIRGVKVGPSPDWLRNRLEAIGIRSINNIVDVTNYVMMEMGQPLHAFDEARVAEGEIHVRAAQDGESFQALDGKSYKLTPQDLVIADAKAAVAIAGVMGGELSGVTNGTTDILLESALFNPQAVRRTSRKLGLASDSSYRFERGIDPTGVLEASARATSLILQVAGGVAEPGVEIAGSIPETSRSVTLRPGRCAALLGIEVPAARIDSILTGFGLTKESGDAWRIPSFRADLTREADLIEEISRAFGIENIPGVVRGFPASASPADAIHDAHLDLRRRLAGMGFYEARSFSLISKSAADETGTTAGDLTAIRNPLIEDQAVLRPSLLPGLFAALERNIRAGAKSIRLFELGRIFTSAGERVHLAALLAGDFVPPSWAEAAPRKTTIFDLKGILENLGIESLEFGLGHHPQLLPAIELKLDGKGSGALGRLAPARQRALGSSAPVAVFEIDLSNVRLRGTPSKLAPIARFPAVTRDIAVIAENTISHASIEGELRGAHEPLLAGLELFDLFSDPSGIRLPADKKSLAYSLTYRSPERTLTADEVNAAHARLKERLKASLSVSFRE